jgi:hypothetical protein
MSPTRKKRKKPVAVHQPQKQTEKIIKLFQFIHSPSLVCGHLSLTENGMNWNIFI